MSLNWKRFFKVQRDINSAFNELFFINIMGFCLFFFNEKLDKKSEKKLTKILMKDDKNVIINMASRKVYLNLQQIQDSFFIISLSYFLGAGFSKNHDDRGKWSSFTQLNFFQALYAKRLWNIFILNTFLFTIVIFV